MISSGCAKAKAPELIVTDDLIGCDATQRKDCVSVTTEFVLQRGELEAQLARYKQALKACQEKL